MRKIEGVTVRRLVGLAAGAVIVGAAIAACRPNDAGYVEIKTVPVAPMTQTSLYIGSTRLNLIKKASMILRQPVGTLKLQADGFTGSLAPLCDIVVKRNRITTVTILVLERPPRCQCRYSGRDPETAHSCVS